MEAQLLELERKFWRAAGDADFYRGRFADDGRCVFGFGILDKEATIASMAAASPWTGVEFTDVSVVTLAPGAAVLTYAATANREGQEEYEATVTSVYAVRDGEWQLVTHQQTPCTT